MLNFIYLFIFNYCYTPCVNKNEAKSSGTENNILVTPLPTNAKKPFFDAKRNRNYKD